MRLWKKEGKHLKFTMTYRTRRRLHRLGVFFGYLLAICLLVWVCWMMWLNRFIVYSGDQAKLDFSWQSNREDAVVALPPDDPTVAIHYNEGDDKIETTTELTPIAGYYVTTGDLIESIPDVTASIKQLPEGSAVVLDLKNIFGTFYYSTGIKDSLKSDKVDVTQVDKLIETVTSGHYYAIAKIPAFRDKHFGLTNDSNGYVLPHISGKYMWADSEGCYWMNPAVNGSIAYVISIIKELEALGFDEVVLSDFTIPASDEVGFEGDRSAAIQKAAEAIVSSASNEHFTVSFASGDTGFTLPAGRTRLYLTGVDAAKVASTADSTTVADKKINLVFLTDTNDTRFNEFSVIRPLLAADIPVAPAETTP